MAKRYKCEYVSNNGCIGSCNKEDRLYTTESDLCAVTNSVYDGLPVRCVGQWAEQKIYLLVQYFGIFAQGMSKKWKLNYIEICSGPGRCVSRSDKTEFDGTSLSVIKREEFKYINKALFFDINERVVGTLNERFANSGITNAKAYVGDYTVSETICSVLRKELTTDSLNLVVIDPTDCSLPFQMIRDLKGTLPKVDFLINVAIWTDYNRNVKNTLTKPDSFSKARKKYSSFVGNNRFYDLIYAGMSDLQLRERFIEEYKTSFKTEGYSFFDFKTVENFYYIFFASQSDRGLDFWNKATQYEFDGQGALF